MTRRYRRLLAYAFLLCALGCTSGPVPLGSPGAPEYDAEKGRPISSSGCGFMLLAFIPIRVAHTLDRAHAALMAKAENDYVTDVKIGTRWTYAYIGTVHCIQIEATAYPLRSAPEI